MDNKGSMLRTLCLVLGVGIGCCGQAWADGLAFVTDSSFFHHVSIGVYGATGYSRMGVIGAFKRPLTMHAGFGAYAAWRVNERFFFGGGTDYRRVVQYTEPGQSGGNYRGWRWNWFSLLLGVESGRFRLTVSPEFVGDYHFSNPVLAGSAPVDVALKGPKGARFGIGYAFRSWLRIGSQLEGVAFNRRWDGVNGDQSSHVSVWNFSVFVEAGR